MSGEFRIYPIGFVRKDINGASIVIETKYREAFLGLEGFSHVMVCYWFDKNDTPDGRALLQDVGVTYPAGTTASAGVLRAYQVIGMPTTVFIAPDGQVVERWTGILTKEKMEELVQELLEASGGS